MEPAAAKLIGAGIACIGMGGAGVGVGIIFGNYLAAAVRNPSAAQGQFGNLIFGFAVTEALGIFSLLIALLLLFVPLGAAPYRTAPRRRADSNRRTPWLKKVMVPAPTPEQTADTAEDFLRSSRARLPRNWCRSSSRSSRSM
jgi:F-type H+-transporting ATPase subunit c